MSVGSALLGVSLASLTVALVPVPWLVAAHVPLFVAVLCCIAVCSAAAQHIKHNNYAVVFTSYYLSLLFLAGALVLLAGALGSDEHITFRLPTPFIVYMQVMLMFHWTEYVFTSLNHSTQQQPSDPQQSEPSSFNSPAVRLSWDSFLLNHSTPYSLAAVASWTEYAVEYWILRSWKQWWWLCWLGLLLCIGGDGLRKLAMCQAGRGFTHLISLRRRPEHELVTDGVYAWTRHPGYVGWFYWSIGTQVLLLNPVCVCAYAAAAWLFFEERVREEEQFLISFFGLRYVDYKSTVPTGLPFIDGCAIPECAKKKQ